MDVECEWDYKLWDPAAGLDRWSGPLHTSREHRIWTAGSWRRSDLVIIFVSGQTEWEPADESFPFRQRRPLNRTYSSMYLESDREGQQFSLLGLFRTGGFQKCGKLQNNYCSIDQKSCYNWGFYYFSFTYCHILWMRFYKTINIQTSRPNATKMWLNTRPNRD